MEQWSSLGAQDLIEPYQSKCTEEAFPVEEAIRLQNIYVVALFKRHLLLEQGYDQYLSAENAHTESRTKTSTDEL